MSKSLGVELLEEFEELNAERKLWDDHYQIIGELVHGTKQSFTNKNSEGERLSDERYDNTAVFAANSLSSALIGMLWPNGARSMRLVPSLELDPDSKANKEYFDKVTQIMVDEMDDPNAGLSTAIDEYILDQVSFGTSGIGVFKRPEEEGGSLLKFESWGIMQLYIAEGKDSRVSTVYRKFEWPLRKVIDTYGIKNLSPKLQEKAKDIKSLKDKVHIIHAIRPRSFTNPEKEGSKNMPFMSVHFEYEGLHIIKESGFVEMPIKVARFRKLSYETYGRAPGTWCLSDVLELDYLRERFSVNVDKSGDPPLVVFDDGKLGSGSIDTSAGAINVLDVSGRVSGTLNPIQPLQTVGELNTTLERIEQLKQNISQYFFLDKLLDFNNQTQMTLGETLIRDRIRGAALGSVFNRQIAETFDPIVNSCFNILLESGRLGVVEGSEQFNSLLAQGIEPLVMPREIAEKIQEGKSVYEIKYFTPAARALQQQEAEALNQVTEYKMSLQQANPEAGDIFNDDEALRAAARIAGIPADIIKSQEEVDEIRQQRADQIAQQQESEQIKQGSETVRNLEQANVI